MQSLCGYTWPGIEYGQPPCYKHSFFEVLLVISISLVCAKKDSGCNVAYWFENPRSTLMRCAWAT